MRTNFVTCLCFSVQVMKRTVQTAVVWTLYEELVPRVTMLAEALTGSSKSSS